jgi:hypothetical protein
MVFLSVRPSSTEPGTIETAMPSLSSSFFSTSSYGTYLTTWDTSDMPALGRRCGCFLILLLHIGININTLISHGIGFNLVFNLLWSVLSIVCIAYALYRLDIMRGERFVFRKTYVYFGCKYEYCNYEANCD